MTAREIFKRNAIYHYQKLLKKKEIQLCFINPEHRFLEYIDILKTDSQTDEDIKKLCEMIISKGCTIKAYAYDNNCWTPGTLLFEVKGE